MRGEEQAGFRAGYSMTDHGFVLDHLINKYAKHADRKLYVAFGDSLAAFDFIGRKKPWIKLDQLDLNRRLLILIMALYKNIQIQDRFTLAGHQASMLAPLLFNLFINDIVPAQSVENNFPVKAGNKNSSVLLYGDDVLLTSDRLDR